MSKGSRVKAYKQTQSAIDDKAQTDIPVRNTLQQTNKPQYTACTDPKNINWVLLSGAMALTVSVLMFMPQQLRPGITSVYSIMLWTGMFGATLFRCLGKGGWIGFFTGSVISMLLHIFAPVIKTLL